MSSIGGQQQVRRIPVTVSSHQDPCITIRQDVEYTTLEHAGNAKINDIQEGRLKLRATEAKELEVYLEREILDTPYIVLRFGRSLRMLKEVDEALRLDQLRDSQELEIGPHGRVQVRLEVEEPRVVGVPTSRPAFPFDAGGLDIYNFQRNTPANIPRTTVPVRALSVHWQILCDTEDRLGLPALPQQRSLCTTKLPPAQRADDQADDLMYADWLRRASDLANPFPTWVIESPSINDFLVFIFASFQQQLLSCLPKTIRPNRHFPEEEGQPYIEALSQDTLAVSQNILRDSYSGLPGSVDSFRGDTAYGKEMGGFTTHLLPAKPGGL
ncbi:hypothetical protein QFC24_003200 [Naganishia onofrii]|uniref:Uncharacterized protein n=1 Tax=Naganishia onofrii TaxID=1851511 RepID=A0ACC2XN89_9TREE|nr:hypothetical protein QFC24_003200 [Naganishia onofrii]